MVANNPPHINPMVVVASTPPWEIMLTSVNINFNINCLKSYIKLVGLGVANCYNYKIKLLL